MQTCKTGWKKKGKEKKMKVTSWLQNAGVLIGHMHEDYARLPFYNYFVFPPNM